MKGDQLTKTFEDFVKFQPSRSAIACYMLMASKSWDSFVPKWEKIQSYPLGEETNKVAQKRKINNKAKLEALQ